MDQQVVNKFQENLRVIRARQEEALRILDGIVAGRLTYQPSDLSFFRASLEDLGLLLDNLERFQRAVHAPHSQNPGR